MQRAFPKPRKKPTPGNFPPLNHRGFLTQNMPIFPYDSPMIQRKLRIPLFRILYIKLRTLFLVVKKKRKTIENLFPRCQKTKTKTGKKIDNGKIRFSNPQKNKNNTKSAKGKIDNGKIRFSNPQKNKNKKTGKKLTMGNKVLQSAKKQKKQKKHQFCGKIRFSNPTKQKH